MKPTNPTFSHAYLRSRMDYEPNTGRLTWKIAPGNGSRPGDSVGEIHGGKRTYLRVTIAGSRVLGHRLIWFWVTGSWPINRIDHDDNDGLNNKWENLREATNQENSRNTKRRVDNKSGYKGVSLHTKTGKWHARIMVDVGKSKSLGLFADVKDAAKAYETAAQEAFGRFRRLE